MPRHPFLNILVNINRRTKAKSVFHSDTSCTAQISSVSDVTVNEVLEAEGATIFANQYAALEAIDSDLRRLVVSSEVLHTATGVPDAQSTWSHVTRSKTVYGRNELFLSSIARCKKLRLADGIDRTDL